MKTVSYRTQGGVVAVVLLLLAGWLLVNTTHSAFSGTRTHTGDVATGTVTLTDNTANGSALWSTTSMTPGDTITACLDVTYTGTLPAEIRTYATTTGDLGSHLTLQLSRGTLATPSGTDCSSFTPDATNPTLYSGVLTGLPTTWGTGIVDPNPAWAASERHAYRWTLTLADTNAAQGLSADTTVWFEARGN